MGWAHLVYINRHLGFISTHKMSQPCTTQAGRVLLHRSGSFVLLLSTVLTCSQFLGIFMYSLFMTLTVKKRGQKKRARWSYFLHRSLAGTGWAKWVFILECASVLHADGSICTKEWECWGKEMKCRALGFFLAFQSSRGTRGNWIWTACSDLRWWSGRDQVALVCLNQKYHLIRIFPLSTGDREQSSGQPFQPATLIHMELGIPAFPP